MRLSLVKPEEVQDFDSFVAYTKQRLGVPLLVKDFPKAKRIIKQFFKQYEQADYQSLVRVVEYARTKKYRYQSIDRLVTAWPQAYAAGYLPECDPQDVTDVKVEKGILDALAVESDEDWRRRLLSVQGLEAKREVLDNWVKIRKSTLSLSSK